MRISRLFFLVIIICCGPQKEDCRLEEHKGTISSYMDGDFWSAYPYGQETNVISINGSYYYQPTCRLQQILSMKLPFKREGIYGFANEVDTIEEKATMLFTFIDVDELLALYRIPKHNENGSIVITSYNSDTRRITGTFNGTVYLDRNYGMEDPKDSLVITNGQFETYFLE